MSAPEDTAERFFGTPERVLRRRHLRPGEEDRDVKEGGKNQLPPEDTDVGPPCGEDFLPGSQEEPESADDAQPSATSKIDRVIALLFHLTAVLFYLYFLLDIERVLANIKEKHDLIPPGSDTYGGRWKHLTALNFHLQAGYFFLALACDILPWLRQYLHKFIDFIFTTTALPAAMSVTLMFWGCTVFLRPYSVGDPSSDTHKFLEVLPPYLNHAVHTVVGLVVILEVALVHHRYPSSSDAIKSLLVWNTSYAAWMYWCYFQDSALSYPLLQLLGPYMLIVFVVLFIVSVIFYYLGKVLTEWCWEARN